MKKIILKNEFSDDHITRTAGEKLRTAILKELEEDSQITIDFTDIVIASTSFLDEAFAKLADSKISNEKIEKLLILKNLNTRDRELLKKLSKRRFTKNNSPRWE